MAARRLLNACVYDRGQSQGGWLRDVGESAYVLFYVLDMFLFYDDG